MAGHRDSSRFPFSMSDDSAARLDIVRGPPSWWMDMLGATLGAVGMAVGCTVLLFCTSLGLVHQKGNGDAISADGVWAGMVAGMCGWMLPYMRLPLSRSDNGYRHDRLPLFLVLVVFVSTVADLAAMRVWPQIVGAGAAEDTVIATLVTNPLSLALVASFLIAIHAWSITCMLAFVRHWKSPAAALILYFGVMGVGCWQGASIFTNPPTIASFTVWSVLAVVSVVVLAVIAAIAGPDRSRDRAIPRRARM